MKFFNNFLWEHLSYLCFVKKLELERQFQFMKLNFFKSKAHRIKKNIPKQTFLDKFCFTQFINQKDGAKLQKKK